MSAHSFDASDPASVSAAAPYPSRLYAWTVVAVLTLAYATSLLDRWILSLLVGPVKAYFKLSDTMIGLLIGPVFAMCYIVMGFPFGWLADRFNRRNIIASAMMVWCLMTAFCGLARTAPQLALARFGIGIGEAGLSPAANSIIADYFPRSHQSRAIGVFTLGVYAGQGASYLLGGLIVGLAMGHSLILPAIGRLEGFQLVFILVGLPGVVLALAVMALREPARRERASAVAATPRGDSGRLTAYLGRHWKAYVPLSVGMGAAPLVGYVNNWLPTLFTRTWGWPVSRFSLIYGAILIVLGPLGAVCSGLVAARINKTGRRDGSYLAALIGVVVTVSCGALMPISPSPYIALALLTPAAFAGAMASAAGVAAIVFATPGEFRGRTLAMYSITNGTIGVFVGPTGVGLLSDTLFTGPTGIRYAFVAIVLVVGGLLTLILSTGLGAYSRAVRALESA